MQSIRYMDWNNKYFTEFEKLAYKAVFERGFVDMDFERPHWQTHLKNLVSVNSNIVRLLFDKEHMIGFYILQLHSLPWNSKTQAIFQLMHLAIDYRSKDIYNSMFRDCQAICRLNNVEKIQTTDQSIQLQHDDKLTFLHNNNFHQIDNIWEVKKDV